MKFLANVVAPWAILSAFGITFAAVVLGRWPSPVACISGAAVSMLFSMFWHFEDRRRSRIGGSP